MNGRFDLLDQKYFTETVRDPLWKNILLTPELMALTSTKDFIRLSRIKQLGPTEIVYPGATHTRASHSLGVYALAKIMLNQFLKKDIGWVTEKGCMSFLVAALLHDLGHFPYAHSLKELPLESHEHVTAEKILKDPLASLISKTKADPFQVASIIDKSIEDNDSETLFFRNLLSGVLDPDKLDYLNRDAFFCGVPYGIQDTDFILAHLLPDEKRGIVLDSSSILSVENILFSKYLMYRSVYWHKDVRIATAMMKKALYIATEYRHIDLECLYHLDDYSLHNLMIEKEFIGKRIVSHLEEKNLYRVIFEVPFCEQNNLHLQLENLSSRDTLEKVLAERIGVASENILIDVPERISFESDLWIKDESSTFSESSTVFKAETIRSFTESIRKIRLAVEKNLLSDERKITQLENEFQALIEGK